MNPRVPLLPLMDRSRFPSHALTASKTPAKELCVGAPLDTFLNPVCRHRRLVVLMPRM